MQIEMMEPRWTDDGARRCYEHLQAEIARAFAVPPHLIGVGRPDVLRQFIARQQEATAALAEQAVRLMSQFTTPQIKIG